MGRKTRRKKPENVIAEVKDNELQEHGVIYGVSGSHRNLLECEFSAKSIKKFHPDLNISLFIDNENKKKIQDTSLFHKVTTLTNPNRRNKLDAILNSPYEKTLY